jgi:uncharacterized protein YndB with AHSA1/START domain
MSEPKFVYVTYIATTPEKLWQALTDGAFTERYWFGTRIESDWTLGAKVRFHSDGLVSDYGVVLECKPYTRLSYSWHVKFHEAFSRERPSRVIFELESMSSDKGAEVKLTIIHDDFDPGSKVLAAVSTGWPRVLASLKSFLETGRALTLTSAEAAKSAKEQAIAIAERETA